MDRARSVWPWALAAAGLLVVAFARPGEGRPPPGPTAWEHRLLAWEPDDTFAVLRDVTGAGELADPEQLAREIQREVELQDDPRIQRAVERRLDARLSEVGAEGWEPYWVRENTTIVGGDLMPTPTVFLRRERRE